MAKNLTRQEIEDKMATVVHRLSRNSIYKIDYRISSPNYPELKDVEQAIYHLYDTTNFKIKSREAHIVFYRHIFCKVAYDAGYKHPSIADYLNKDRTTIIHAIRKIEDYLEIKDPETTKVYKNIINHLIDTYGETIFRRDIIQRVNSQRDISTSMCFSR